MSHHTPARTNRHASDTGQPTVLVVGGDQLGLGLAERLARTSLAVAYVGEGHAGDRDVDVYTGSATDPALLAAVAEDVGAVDAVVAAGSDSRALLAAHLSDRAFAPAATLAIVDDPRRVASFAETSVEPVETAAALSEDVERRLRRVVTA